MNLSGPLSKMILWLLVFQLFLPFPLFAEGVGKFIDVKGTVSLKRASGSLTPAVDDPVFVKDLITTKEKSRAKLLLANNVQCSVASRSSLEITAFLLKDGKESSVLSVTSGAVHTKILKMLTPEAKIQVRTPDAVAGARGTEWLTVLEEPSEGAPSKSVFYTLDKSITVSNPEFPAQDVTVNAGQYSEVVKGRPPTIPAAFSMMAIIGILINLGVPAPAGAGTAGGLAGHAAAAGISAGTIAGVVAGAAAVIAGTAAATGGGGGGSGVAATHGHSQPMPR